MTRWELLAVTGAVALVLAVALPGLAEGRGRSGRLQCLNNLRQVGNAFLIWRTDHNGLTPVRVPVAEGGTFPDVSGAYKVGLAWYEFAWISNELVTPRILACPSDTGTRRVAQNFTADPNGGLLHVSYRNNAISYFLNLDIGTRNLGGRGSQFFYEFSREEALVGDRNLRVDATNVGCSTGMNNVAAVSTYSWLTGSWGVSGWTNGIHEFSGNMAINDGSVRESSLEDFRTIMSHSDDNGLVHLLMPR